MIAVDTNLLVYAHREDAKFHAEAYAALVQLAAGTERWAVPWPCAHEFIAIVTHPKIYKTPTPLERALEALAELNACPTLEFINEADGYLDSLSAIALAARVQGEGDPRCENCRDLPLSRRSRAMVRRPRLFTICGGEGS
jgi:predicted nucleic acid-binding protein